MPARMVTWDELPEPIKQMDPDERESFLLRNNAILMPRGVAPPPNAIFSAPSERERNIDTSSADVMGFGPGLTHPENRENMMKAAAAGASTALGGGGPVAIGASAALNAAFGPKVNSGRGVAENVANVAFGRLNPVIGPALSKGSSMAQAAKQFLAGAGQVTGTQAAGAALQGEDQNMNELIQSALAGGVGTSATNAFLQGVQNSTPMVRKQMAPIVERLKGKPPAVAQTPTPAVAPTPMPLQAEEAVDPFTQKIRQTIDYIQKKNPEMYGIESPSVSAQSSQNDLEEQLRKSLIAAGKDPAPLPPPASKPVAAAVDTPVALKDPPITVSAIDEMAAKNPNATAFKRLGGKLPSDYIEETVSGKEWGTLPDVMREMDAAFPEGQFRDAVRQKITEKVLGGIGEAGAFGDLSPLQRIQAFGKQKFGEKTGAQVINQIFDSPEAYRNLSDLQEIIEISGRSATEKGAGQSKARFILNNWRPVLAGSGGLGAMQLTAYIPAAGTIGAAALGGAAAYGASKGAVKAITLTAESIAEFLGKKNSKWADVLYDMATGGNRYSAQSISNVISGLRRRATEERDLTDEEAAAEYAQQ